MIASITSCAITAGRSAGFHGYDRRQGDRRQATAERRQTTAERRKPAAAPRPDPQPATAARGPGRPGLGDSLRTLAPMATATRMTEAARAFSAGNCYLSGTLIDRCI